MSLTPSNMLPLGTSAPDFNLPDVFSGEQKSLQDLRGDKATVVMFICNHCPYVIHVLEGLVQAARDYQARGVSFIAISSNDVDNFPDDAPALMKVLAESEQFPFPYLYDETQSVAKAYEAACTPDLFLFDAALQCVYRGQFDDARPGKDTPVTGNDLRAALDALLAGQPVSDQQTPSMGCNIKWK